MGRNIEEFVMTEAETTGRIGRKRPVGVWIIAILYVICLGVSFYSVGTPSFGYLLDNPLVILKIAYSAIPMILTFVSIVLLFMLNRFAFHFLVASFIWGLLRWLYKILCTDWLSENGSAEYAGAVTSILVLVITILYMRSLTKKGILS